MIRRFVSVVYIILRKDLRLWIQQPINMAAIFVPALSLLLVMAVGSASVGKSPVALVTLDQSSQGIQMKQMFHTADVFNIIDTTPQRAQNLFKEIQVVAIITIPADFTQRVKAHQTTPIDIQVNNLNTDFTTDIRRSVPDVITQFYASQGSTSPVNITMQEQDLRHYDIQLFQYTLLPIITLVLMMSSVINSGLSTSREWESLTVKELLCAPIARSAIILGKILAGFITTLLLGSLLVILGSLLGWVQPHGIYWFNALLIIALLSLMGAGIGVALGATMQRLQPVIAMGLNVVLYLFFLAGGVSVLAFAQDWLQNIAAFVPLTYGRHALEMALFYNSSDLLGRDVGVLAGCACATLFLGILAMRREISR